MARRDLTGAVDFSVLEGMTGGDRAINEEVLGLFVNQAALWSALLDPKVEGWRDGVHTIRGAAAGIGARDLAATCAEAEGADQRLAAPAVERVRDALEAALADVAAYRHELMLSGLKG
ncbi:MULTISPECIES: Hpt domain-containing protein [unclassified Brevundimonas]|uniref:Hpt domain-containing protein n=1 Tax=unclassified Brevundimonas TaxID=2622653 RepID=UPI000E95A491|nr:MULTISPECIES: Hpt domain-containing protein [unclassified Brevundimonas]MCK6102962.1 Hpt domain-containing protein [Brevundimonas sp. EYE_349]HBI19053.1 Hpt domain-containing protein [Brevundimonas sp.]